MSGDLQARIEEILAAAGKGLSVRELSAAAACEQAEAEQVIWGAPERFTWQPGGQWALAGAKRAVRADAVEPGQHDTRGAVLDPPGTVELRAITLGNGSVLRVTSRPLDSAAFFTVDRVGGDLQLVLNSAHEVFAELPTPFAEEGAAGAAGDHKRLLELLLAAWAVYEGDVPPGAPKRELEDTRLMWGRALPRVFPAQS